MEYSDASSTIQQSIPDTYTISLIAAVATNGVIGSTGNIPWSYPADLAHFKQTTSGHPVVVGRRTHESIVDTIGGPLPQRETIVLSTTTTYDSPSVTTATTVDDAVSQALATADTLDTDTIYVIGGESLYEQYLPVATELVLTTIPEEPDGDTHFPEWDQTAWTVTNQATPGDVVITTYHRT